MLPLDQLSDAALAALIGHGIEKSELSVAVRLDQDFDGRFGESWLVYQHSTKTMHRLLGEPEQQPGLHLSLHHGQTEPRRTGNARTVTYADAIDMTHVLSLTADTCLSTNRLLADTVDTSLPDGYFSASDEEQKKTAADAGPSHTAVLGYCANGIRPRLNAFVKCVERLLAGDAVGQDDDLFEPFNEKCPKCGKVYEDQRRKICADCRKRDATLKRLFKMIGGYKKELTVIISCMALSVLISLFSPLLSGTVLYDRVISESGDWHSLPMLFAVLTAIFVFALLSLGISILQARTNARLHHHITIDLRTTMFNKIMDLSLSYFNKHPVGYHMNAIVYDAGIILDFFQTSLPTFIINVATFVFLAVITFCLNWKMSLMIFLPVPIIFFIFKNGLPKLRRAGGNMYRTSWRMSSALNDSLTGIRVVKAFAKETEESHRFHKAASNAAKAVMTENLVMLTIFPIISILIGISSQMIWGVGGLSVMGEKMTYGEFTAFLGYIGMIFGPIQFFTNFASAVTNTRAAAERMFEIQDKQPEIFNARDAVVKERFDGDIEFRDVSFQYDPERPILKNINLKIHAGDNIGLVGHTGSGKSTIVNLITRMYDPNAGSIYIDGINVKKLDLKSLRSNVAIVSQEIFLFRGTVADNIRYAKPDATMQEIIEAAKIANAHGFISHLPEGYETFIGTGSRTLSGGERQRISIARAVLMSPSILILDEATAAMDTETERMISDSLAELVKGRTCISIAHRLSTLKDCNYLFVIENGMIKEEGEPEELLSMGGEYYKLFTLQSEAMKKVLEGT